MGDKIYVSGDIMGYKRMCRDGLDVVEEMFHCNNERGEDGYMYKY